MSSTVSINSFTTQPAPTAAHQVQVDPTLGVPRDIDHTFKPEPKADEKPIAPAPPAAAKVEPPAVDAIAQRAQALARKERQMIQERRQFKAEREAAIKIQQEAQAEKQKQEAFWANLAKDPFAALNEKGLTYEKLTEMQLTGQKVAPEVQVSAVRDELEKIKAEYRANEAAKVQAEVDARSAQADETLRQFNTNILNHAKKDPEKYELTNMVALDAVQEAVYGLTDLFFKRTNKILSIEEGTNAFEEFLSDLGAKMAGSKKLAGRAAPAKPDPKPGFTPAKDLKPPTKTLSNNMTTSSGKPIEEGGIISEEEAVKRYLAKRNASA